jgi:4-hydroxy-3-polyprenylbenzoate decarboxylase
LIVELVRAGGEVDLSITPAGCKVLRHELGVEAGEYGEELGAALESWLGLDIADHVHVHASDAIGAAPASGTARNAACVLAPCSMGTLARVAHGFSSNLVERAADVALKEGRRLLLVPRETPLSIVHLENMLRMARLGAVVLPAMPGWYHAPRTLDDLIEHLVGKILDRLGIEHRVGRRWAGLAEPVEAGIEPPSGEESPR